MQRSDCRTIVLIEFCRLSIYEQQRQICVLRANLLGRNDDEHKQMAPDHSD